MTALPNQVQEVRVAVGCVGPTPRRLRDVEGLLSQKAAGSPGHADAAGALAGSAADAVTDLHGSAEYKTYLVGVLLRRGLCAPISRPSGRTPAGITKERDSVTDNRAHDSKATGQVLSIHVTVNGHAHDVLIEPYLTLIELIRDRLGLTGTKKSCDMQVCGAYAVLLNGRPVSACTMLAFEARNAALLTMRAWPRARPCIPFSKPSSSTAGCNAASARPG